MLRNVLYVMLAVAVVSLPCDLRAEEVLVPAGTLLHCTLNEPNFSSATAEVGDPVICHLSSLQIFGHNVFPRGSYLAGHLEADKDPGHFVGKGFLNLQFDRIGLPNTDVPVPSKVIAARDYRVDRAGDILGKGHAKRDAAEWMFPPLWPWKIASLPARGPRPAMKGEEQLTLRLMDDITLPASPTSHELTPGWHRFGEPTSSIGPDLNRVPAGKASSTPAEVAGTEALIAPTGNLGTAPRLTLIATKSGATYPVTKYRIDHDRLSYISRDGIERSIGATEVDWKTTSQLNAERSSAVQSRPAQSPIKLELATVN